MLFIKAIKMSMSMMHVTQRFAKNELYIQFQKVNVGLFRDYSKSIYQCQALFQWLLYSQMCKITGIYLLKAFLSVFKYRSSVVRIIGVKYHYGGVFKLESRYVISGVGISPEQV